MSEDREETTWRCPPQLAPRFMALCLVPPPSAGAARRSWVLRLRFVRWFRVPLTKGGARCAEHPLLPVPALRRQAPRWARGWGGVGWGGGAPPGPITGHHLRKELVPRREGRLCSTPCRLAAICTALPSVPRSTSNRQCGPRASSW
jgi:hypothetical protein